MMNPEEGQEQAAPVMASACKEVEGEENAALRELIGWARKGKATPGMDCALHKGWMSQIELVETEAHHMEGRV